MKMLTVLLFAASLSAQVIGVGVPTVACPAKSSIWYFDSAAGVLYISAGASGAAPATCSWMKAGATGPQGKQGVPGPAIAGLSSDGANGIVVVGNIKSGTGPTTVAVQVQPTKTCTVPAGYDAALCVGIDLKLHCTLSAAKGGGSCN